MKRYILKARSKGFTLIELLVVIAIMGVLAGVVLVSVNNARLKAANVRVLAEVSQIRSALEQGYTAANGYTDLVGSGSHKDSLVISGPSILSLTTLLCGIGSQGGYPVTVSGDITLTCDGVSRRSGVIVYSNGAGPSVMDYGVYATTTPGGYVCADSFGHTVTSATSSIPAYANIISTSTALCQ